MNDYDYHKRSAEYYRQRSTGPLRMPNNRRMDELTASWHEEKAQAALEKEHRASSSPGETKERQR